MSLRPWISVIVPVYNGERYLKAALESVIEQADEGVELLVADDGSTDGSRGIAAACQGRAQIVVVDGPKAGNWVANTNRAVARARGELVTFLHQDDLWLPGRIDAIRTLMKSNPGQSLWIGPTQFIDARGRRAGDWNLPFPASAHVVDSDTFLQRLLVQNFVGMPSPVFRREDYDRVGGMDEDLWFTADWDLWIKLAILRGVAIQPRATVAFRLHAQSQTMTGAAQHQAMRDQIEAVRARYISRLRNPEVREAVERAGRFSSELNSSLAALVSSQPVRWRGLLASFAGLGPSGCRRFVRDARFLERSMARLRVGVAARLRK